MTIHDRSVLKLRRLLPEPIQRRNYLKLRRLLPDLDQLPEGRHLRLVAKDRKRVEVIVQCREGERLLLNFGHYIELDGDVVPNPAASLLVDLVDCIVAPLSYQDRDRHINGLDRVVPDSDAAALDDYLSLWLSNLHEQGYRVAS